MRNHLRFFNLTLAAIALFTIGGFSIDASYTAIGGSLDGRSLTLATSGDGSPLIEPDGAAHS